MSAQFWKALSKGRMHCRLCSRFCVIGPGARGFCGVRENNGRGVFPIPAWSGVAALGLDPVEKKPLYHYLPGTRTFSFAAPGCNFACAFCQNSALSHSAREGGAVRQRALTPAALVGEALRLGAASVSFTYSEPTVFFELMAQTADAAADAGLGTILVSNGYQSPQSLAALKGRVSAANIDLKAFSGDFYRRQCGARLAPVPANLRRMREFGWWLEVTTLLIPGLNDGTEELRRLARFIARDLGTDVPWHISRFHPAFRMRDRPPTPPASLERAARIGKDEGLAFVYLGNLPGAGHASTLCPACGRILLAREGYAVEGLPFDGRCPCGTRIPGIWEQW